MNRSIYALTILGLLILSSCQDDQIMIEKEIRLDYYIESYYIDDHGFTPQLKVAYEYDYAGRITKYTVLGNNPNTTELEEQRYFAFSYSNGKVEHIKGYLPGSSSFYIDYSYQYLPTGEVLKITENNRSTGINSEVIFTYEESGSVKVVYAFSNGGSFEYVFNYSSENILSDKTTRGSQLCSDGQYTYDQHINPFKNLGYVDYLLNNLSANNKLTENVNYVGCAFPTLVPESYTYVYNDNGYPISATTFYKSQGSVKKSRKDFFYKSR